ncbi:MAG: hypothetical protein WDW38_011574 [Sanguina aurantia]
MPFQRAIGSNLANGLSHRGSAHRPGGGVLGLLLTSVGVLSVGAVIPAEFAALARLDFSLLAITVVLAVVATLLAAVYPAYRASQVPPAMQLKSNEAQSNVYPSHHLCTAQAQGFRRFLIVLQIALTLAITVYQDGKPAAIVGIVERLQNNVETDSTWEYNAVIEPLREDVLWTVYVARARPGQAHQGLCADRGMAVLMGVICVILLSVTAAGIVGLTSFWVGQRYRQIGVRRALGARKIDILRYFQIENLLIAGAAAAIGVMCALGLNLWLMKNFEMMRLPLPYLAIGVLAMFALGQAAVFVPARRASNVPPVVATRSV